jgi:hypothetical protein
LVGGDYFRDAARQLQQTQASSSGDLANVGEAFSVFLQQRHQADRFCYLADVARFEWLCQKSKLAAGHACLDLIKLASVPRADYDELHFVLHPSVELFESSYPCLEIWHSHAEERIDNDSIDLDSGGCAWPSRLRCLPTRRLTPQRFCTVMSWRIPSSIFTRLGR